jgi:surface polysaccharide O-acyltransferase-like enzyme
MTTAPLYDPPYALWTIWHQLSPLQHGFVYTLCFLCLYPGFCVVSGIGGFISIRRLGIDDPASARTVIVLRNRCSNLRSAILAEFYLFGIVLFIAFQFVGQFIIGSNIEGKILGQFVLDAAFATNVFAVLFILHLAQWAVSIRLTTYTDNLSRIASSAP